jgi:hypothetical protein
MLVRAVGVFMHRRGASHTRRRYLGAAELDVQRRQLGVARGQRVVRRRELRAAEPRRRLRVHRRRRRRHRAVRLERVRARLARLLRRAFVARRGERLGGGGQRRRHLGSTHHAFLLPTRKKRTPGLSGRARNAAQRFLASPGELFASPGELFASPP